VRMPPFIKQYREGVLQKLELTDKLRAALRKDDVELLQAAEKWVILHLFGKDAAGELNDHLA